MVVQFDLAYDQLKAQWHEPGGIDEQEGLELTLQRNLFFETFQFHLLSPVRKVRPMVSLLGPSNKPNHHFNIKGPHRQDCS